MVPNMNRPVDKDDGQFVSPDKRIRASQLSNKSPHTGNKLIDREIDGFFKEVDDDLVKPKKIGATGNDENEVGRS